MKTILGKLPDSTSVVQINFDETIQSVDEIISPAQCARVEDYVAQGFIDLQVNGFAGVDFNDPSTSQEQLLYAARAMASTGVTQCLPTVITAPRQRMRAAFQNLAAAVSTWESQQRPERGLFAGFHMEGPHLSPEDGPRGAHPRQDIRPPSTAEFDEMQEAARGAIRVVTISPEWEGSRGYIEHVVRQGVVASIGHTQATGEQIASAVAAGATMSTHLGNGAHSNLHKTQNYIWEQLAQDKLNAGFIVDGIHLPEAFVRAASRAKGLERCFLVTDAVAPAMCPPGNYVLAGNAIELRANGSVVLRGTERLAGSALRMDHAVSNMVRMAGVSLREAIALATVHPARAARLSGRRRGLVPGERADLVLFRWDSQTGQLQVSQTFIGGAAFPAEAITRAGASL